MDGTIAQATHERARSLSTRYNVQDAERLAAALPLNAGGGETNTIVELRKRSRNAMKFVKIFRMKN